MSRSLISVVLADDHSITRKGLQALLAPVLGAEVVGEAEDGLEAARLVREHQPTLLVLDLSLPGLNGLDVLKQVREQSPNTRTIILSMHSERQYVMQAIQYGAQAYVLKGSSASELVKAVREALDGRFYLSSELPSDWMRALKNTSPAEITDPYDTLTNREREILQLIAEGHTSVEIGERLYISPRTVDKHRSNLMGKLEVRNQAEVIHFAVQRGLIL